MDLTLDFSLHVLLNVQLLLKLLHIQSVFAELTKWMKKSQQAGQRC